MATLADSLVSSSARKLAMRMRPDLTARQHRYQGRVYWVIKEPVGLNYFRFQEEEYAILQMLDGRSSLDDIKAEFEARFPPQKIGVEELQQFIGMLHRSGLIIANVPGQGKQLKLRRDERWRKEWINKLSNILSIRFKGIDPDRILNWLHPKLQWMYTRTAVLCCALLALSALSLVLVQFEVFQSKLPSFHQFFNLKNAVWLSIALGVTKVMHEFGHGLTCKHFGGECHEMGVMILVLTPCLYCNVSDSWMLPNKWHRIAIGAGGMYIEVVIASICTFIWWFTEPGHVESSLPEHDVRLLGQHVDVQCQSAAALRRLLHPGGSDGDPQPAAKGFGHSQPQARSTGAWDWSSRTIRFCRSATRSSSRCTAWRPPSIAGWSYFRSCGSCTKVWKPYRLEIIGQIIGVAAIVRAGRSSRCGN